MSSRPILKSKISRLSVVLFFSVFFVMPTPASAFLINFGGMVYFTLNICETPPGTLVYIGPPTTMSLMYLRSDKAYAYLPGQPRPGRWILGKAVAYSPCIKWVECGYAKCPIFLGGGPIMVMHGSSK